MKVKVWLMLAIPRVLSLFVGKLFPQVRVVRIEGGLGSQILGYLRYLEECRFAEVRGMRPPIVDTSYFDIKPEQWNRDVSLWPWHLDAFGVSRNKLATGKYTVTRIVRLHPSSYDFEWIKGNRLISLGRTHKRSFPADQNSAAKILKALGIDSVDSEYSVVHLRRGDYLRVAGLIYSEGEVMELLRKIRKQIPQHVIIISDSLITDEIRSQIQDLLAGTSEVRFLDEGIHSALDIHNLMRFASLLIASNSTFSITAGILNEVNGVVFAPLNFTTEEAIESPDAFFRSSGRFLLMS